MLTVTASIGVAVLKSALRLKKNHIEYKTVEHFDALATGCYKCPYYTPEKECCARECQICAQKQYTKTQEKVYVNEKNRYGERHPLQKNALLLFLYLHFQNPDKAGLVEFEVETAAQELGCSIRTVQNNLRLLHEHSYIAFSKGRYPGHYYAFLMEFKNYFKKAAENGRGYFTMSKEIFQTVSEMEDINSVRLALRSFAEYVEEDRKPDYVNDRTFDEIKRNLPEYCTKKDIRETVKRDGFQKMFQTAERKHSIILNMRKEFNPFVLVEKIILDGINRITTKINDINLSIIDTHQSMLFLTEPQIRDIAKIALKHPVQHILDAVQDMYEGYTKLGLEVKEPGALVRTIVKTQEKYAGLF